MLELSRLRYNLDRDCTDGRIGLSAAIALRNLVDAHDGGALDDWEFRRKFEDCCRAFPDDLGTAVAATSSLGRTLCTLVHKTVFFDCMKRVRDRFVVTLDDRTLKRHLDAAARTGRTADLGSALLDGGVRAAAADHVLRTGVVWLFGPEPDTPNDTFAGFDTDDRRSCLPFELGLPRPPAKETYVVVELAGGRLHDVKLPTVVAGDPFMWLAGGRTRRRDDPPACCGGPFRVDGSGAPLPGLPESIVIAPPWKALASTPVHSMTFLRAAS